MPLKILFVLALCVGVGGCEIIFPKYDEIIETLESGKGIILLKKRFVINVFEDGTISGFDNTKLVPIYSVATDKILIDYYRNGNHVSRLSLYEQRKD